MLWFIPPPGRMMLADKLHGLGIRHHAELATLQLEREGPKALGNHAPQRVVAKSSMQEGLEALRQVNPDLVARIDAAKADPDMSARIANAKSQAEKEQIAKELGIDLGAGIASAQQHMGDV